MDKDDDRVLGLDSLDFMNDNGEEFFLATEDGATYAKTDEILNVIAKLKEIKTNLDKFTFEELETSIEEQFSDEVKELIAEYEKELELWKEAREIEDKELGPFKESDPELWIKRKKR